MTATPFASSTGAAAFTMPSKYRLIDMLRADLKAAGIPYRLDPAHGKVVDFGCIRIQ